MWEYLKCRKIYVGGCFFHNFLVIIKKEKKKPNNQNIGPSLFQDDLKLFL